MTIRAVLEENIKEIKGQRYQFLLLKISDNQKVDFKRVLQGLEIPCINVNLLLATKLKEFPVLKRKRVVRDVLREIINGMDQEILYFASIEYSFDEELNQDPFGIFEYLSGNKVLLINWPGEVVSGELIYATPDHPEHIHEGEYKEHLVFI